MPPSPPRNPVIFESTAPAEALLRGFAKAVSGEEPGSVPLPATLNLRGTVNGHEVAVHRQVAFRRPSVEFRGAVSRQPTGSALAGAYRDLREMRRICALAVFLMFTVVSFVSGSRIWDRASSFSIFAVWVVAAVATVVMDRFHILNRNTERDLLRSDIRTIIGRIETE
jgi:hypothetical protein